MLERIFYYRPDNGFINSMETTWNGVGKVFTSAIDYNGNKCPVFTHAGLPNNIFRRTDIMKDLRKSMLECRLLPTPSTIIIN